MSRYSAARKCGQVLAVVCLLGASAAQASTWPVAPGESIADALSMAAAGDTVLVDCGVYREQGLVLPDGVTLAGETGQADCVTIAGDGSASILVCEGPAFGSLVVGIVFTLAEGHPAVTTARGGGVFCDGASPSIIACRFEGLQADYGAAVYARAGSPRLSSCDFFGNAAAAVGGALAAVGDALPRLDFCLLAGNSAGVSGSAVNAALGAAPALVSCTLDGHAGSALAGWDGAPTLVSRTLVTGGGTAFMGDPTGVPGFDCTDIFGNGSDWSGLIAPQETLGGNFSLDPHYCSDGTYTLDVGSPCTAAGNPTCGYIGARGTGCDEVSSVEGPDDPGTDAPRVTRLGRIFPNPFNPRTTVQFDLERSGPVKIEVYDLAGRRVRTLVDESLVAGSHEEIWTGDDRNGRPLAAGVYFIRMQADEVVTTKRVALVK